jgi:drug/metabolite transporter (DMT)-like permease
LPDEEYRPPYRLLNAGMAFAVAVNVLVIVLSFSSWGAFKDAPPPIGNIAAVLMVAGAWWLIRRREKGRL